MKREIVVTMLALALASDGFKSVVVAEKTSSRSYANQEEMIAAALSQSHLHTQAQSQSQSQHLQRGRSSSHGFDLLTDEDDTDDAGSDTESDSGSSSLASSGSSTLEELKKIGSSIDSSKSSGSSGGFGKVTLGAGNSGSGASTMVILGEAKETGIFIPFGKTVPAMPGVKHYTATGHQECRACQQLINTMYLTGPMFPDLTWGLPPEYKEMGKAQQAVLQACPEFMNNWCYEDLGGTQMLRSPCPAYLTCHYCLGLNPLHCLPDDLSDRVTFYH